MSAAVAVAASSLHCIFCLKPIPPQLVDSSSSSWSVSTRRAVTFLERHLKLEPGSIKDYMTVCQQSCASTLETFCGLYEQIKGLELRLEGEVDKLRRVVEHANRVPTRGAWVKQCYQQGEGEGPSSPLPHSKMDKMYTWRRSFSKRCLTHLASSFPKVLISKLQPTPLALRGGTTEGHVMNHECDEDDDDDDDVDDSLPVCSPSTSPCTSTSAVTVQECIEPQTGKRKHQLYLHKLLPNPPKVFTTSIKLFTPLLPPPPSPKLGTGFGNDDDAAAGRGHKDHKLKGTTGTDIKVKMVNSGGNPVGNPKVWRTTWRRRGGASSDPSLNTCPVCRAGFAKTSNLKRHISTAHDLEAAGMTDKSEAFQCSQCPAWFTTRRSMDVHMLNSHKTFELEQKSSVQRVKLKAKWTCAKCGDGKDWKCKTKLERHLRRCNGRNRNWCGQCGKQFKNWAEKKLHIVAVHGGRKCDQPGCQFVTRNPLSLDRHRGGDRCPFPSAWICTSCGDGRNWENRTNFERHVKLCRGGGSSSDGGGLMLAAGRPSSTSNVTAPFIRKGKRPYYCAVCSKLFFSERARTIHFRIKHDDDVSGLKKLGRGDVVKRCGWPGCSAYFRTLAQLSNHENEFHGGGNTSQNKSQGLKVHQLAVVDPLDDEMEGGYHDHHHHPIGDDCKTNALHQDVDGIGIDVKFVLPH